MAGGGVGAVVRFGCWSCVELMRRARDGEKGESESWWSDEDANCEYGDHKGRCEVNLVWKVCALDKRCGS